MATGIYGFKPAFRRSLQPLARALGDTSPDAVSYAAVGLSALAAVAILLAQGEPLLWLVVAPLLVARLAANALDGMLAQAQRTASPRGELVNELSDRVSDALVLGALVASGAVAPLLGAAAIGVTLLVSYMGILPKAAGGERLYAGPMGKADRMVLLAAAAVGAALAPALAWMTWAAWALVALGLVTLANRTRLAWRRLGGA